MLKAFAFSPDSAAFPTPMCLPFIIKEERIFPQLVGCFLNGALLNSLGEVICCKELSWTSLGAWHPWPHPQNAVPVIVTTNKCPYACLRVTF